MATRLGLIVSSVALIVCSVLSPARAYQYFVGFNTWWAPSAAYYGRYPQSRYYRDTVERVFTASQGLGLTVARSWAFNDQLPAGPGQYDEQEFEGLDYFVASAPRHGMRSILCIGNFWHSFVGPDNFVAWAEGSADGKTINDFYSNNATITMYKQHTATILNRKNSFTGIAYKDDPSIMGYDVLNEPRCPACDSQQEAVRRSWLAEMAAFVHGMAPGQLVFSGTEGYFQGNYAKYNPGAGATCEGEDWPTDNSISGIQVATAHLYFRQIETELQLGWRKLNIDEYLNYLVQKINVLNELSGSIGKPWIAEEFGLTYNFFGEEERKMVFVVIFEKLIAAKKGGLPFMGALFWNAAVSGQYVSGKYVDGYEVYVDMPRSSPIALGSDVRAPGQASTNATAAASSSPANSSTAVRAASASASSWPLPGTLNGRRLFLARQLEAGAGRQLHLGRAHQSSFARNLHDYYPPVINELTPFQQGPARAACANAAAYHWRMLLPNNLVDVDYYRALVAGHNIVDIIAAAASVINGG